MAFASAAPRTFAFTAFPRFSAKFSLWRMLRDALSQAHQVQADRDIEHYLESTGGKLTDEGEREIMRRLFNNSSSRW
ncbi:MAG: hypothetical protein HY244_01770 [Rhizobiales bacterium]|nr:hypothetical protein [Hyphomicrobiales bacterium]